jgi:chromosome segregation ATPase
MEDTSGFENTIFLAKKGFNRVINLDGTSLSNGMFESGHHSNIFDKNLGKMKHDKELKDKKGKLETVMKVLATLNQERGKIESAIGDAKREMISKETKIKLMEETFNNMSNFDKEKKEATEAMKLEIAQIESGLKEVHVERTDLNKYVNSIQQEISEIEATFFADFLKKAKIDDISEFEGTNIKEFEDNARLKQQYTDNLNQVKAQIDQLGIEQCMRAIELLKTEETEVDNQLKLIEEELLKFKDEMSTNAGLKDNAVKDVHDFRKKQDREDRTLKKEQDDLDTHKRRVQELQRQMQETKYELKSKYIKLLKKLVLMETITDKEATKKYKKMDLTKDFAVIVGDMEEYEFDFGDDFRIKGTDKAELSQVSNYMEDLQKQLKEKEKAIEDFERVSMLAPECQKEIKDLADKMKELQGKYDTEGEEGKTTGEKLRELRTKRTELISGLTNTLDTKVNLTYQLLTRKDAYIFGTSHLSIEDKKNPFNGTINFIPNPPGKRSIYDIQQLSSGEKTMAALSFVFTLIK